MSSTEISDVAIIGTGIGGLMTALELQRHGVTSTLFERDPPPDDSISPKNSWDWARKGVPQAVQPHFFMGRLRSHLEAYHPQLLNELFAAGAGESELIDYIHPNFVNRIEIKPEDARLCTLNCRRTTFEMVIRKYAATLPAIRIENHAKVTDIKFSSSIPGSVTGIHYEQGGKNKTLNVDVVVDATGRSGKLATILEGKGIRFDVDQRDSGLWYFTRHYQLKPGAQFPNFIGLPGARFADFTGGSFPADNGHLTVTLQVFSQDKALVTAIRDPDHFHKVCEQTQAVARWVDPDQMTPTSKVHGFGQMDSFWRKTVINNKPQLLNYFFVGDSCIRSNPRFGRGCTWSTLAGHDLAEIIASDMTPQQRIMRYEASLEARFRRDWQTMLDIDLTAEREFTVALGLDSPTIGERLKQKINLFVEDAMVIEPKLFREIWTGYNGFQNMDAWMRKPINALRLLRAWVQRRKYRSVLESQRGRLSHQEMVNA